MQNRREPRHDKRTSMGERCPKCSGLVERGGVTFGRYDRHAERCTACGLSNESERFYDALNNKVVAIR